MNVHIEQAAAEHIPPRPVGEVHQDTHPRPTRRSSLRSTARRVGILFSSLVLASVGTVAGATPASAGSDELIVTERGSVGWYHAGDKLVVADAKNDGLSIEGNARTVGGGIHVIHVAGAGKSKTWTWNLVEGTNIQIRMCYRDGSVVTKCSGWQNAEA